MNNSSGVQVGDVLRRQVSWGVGYHYGVVIAVGGKKTRVAELRMFGPREASLGEFSEGKPVSLVSAITYAFSRGEVAWRASYLSKQAIEYSIVDYNCEHFVTHIVEGAPRSLQSAIGQLAILATDFGAQSLIQRKKPTPPEIPAMPRPTRSVPLPTSAVSLRSHDPEDDCDRKVS